jgi:hypothetical protein
MTQYVTAAVVAQQPIQRVMPMHCDCCEVSQQLGLLAVAMYELNTTGQRIGRVRKFYVCANKVTFASSRVIICVWAQIELFSMARSYSGELELKLEAAVDCSGVFDVKWGPGIHTMAASGAVHTSQGEQRHVSAIEAAGFSFMAAALADGSCTLMQAGRGGIQPVAVASDAAIGGMALSCDWDTANEAIYCSYSNGHVSCCRAVEADMQVETSWKAHDMEVWMVSCDVHRVSTPTASPLLLTCLPVKVLASSCCGTLVSRISRVIDWI